MSTKRSLAAHRLGIAFAVLGALWSSGAPVAEAQKVSYDDAEVIVVAPEDPADKALWGTEDRVTYTVSGASFQGSTGRVVRVGDGTTSHWVVYPNGGTAYASLTLPTGARVTAVELSGCDHGSSDELQWIVFAIDDTGHMTQSTDPSGTGVAATPGCTFFFNGDASPFTIDNFLYSYVAYVIIPDGELTYSLTSFRIYYKLQVSPPPSSATFSDVPTGHRFFRYVEALAASGITGGCGGNRFCPGSPLTRGQMAVFLAKALGLHWPN